MSKSMEWYRLGALHRESEWQRKLHTVRAELEAYNAQLRVHEDALDPRFTFQRRHTVLDIGDLVVSARMLAGVEASRQGYIEREEQLHRQVEMQRALIIELRSKVEILEAFELARMVGRTPGGDTP